MSVLSCLMRVGCVSIIVAALYAFARSLGWAGFRIVKGRDE